MFPYTKSWFEHRRYKKRIVVLEAAQDICQGTTKDFLNGKQLPGNWSDGTDGACPGWWRGLDYGCEKMNEKLLKRTKAAEAAEAENAKLREALEFYADPWAWNKKHSDGGKQVPDFYFEMEYGDRAVTALANQADRK